VASALLFPAGVVLDSTLLLAVGWTGLLWTWISSRFEFGDRVGARKLLVLPLLSFPWIANDFTAVGWWFRLSGAAAAERLLAWFNFDVHREGTFLLVGNLPLQVEPACSGLNGLEAILIAGSTLAYVKLKQSSLFWWNLGVLVSAAWVANLARILAASVYGAGFGPDEAMNRIGPVHIFAGWLALCVMFGFCWVLITVEEQAVIRWRRIRPPTEPSVIALKCLVIGYCGWRCHELLDAWRHSPFDRLGWLAFILWLSPVAFACFQTPGILNLVAAGRLSYLAWGGIATFTGDLGDLNLLRQAGLALALMSLMPRQLSGIRGLTALTWVSASGWIGSRLGAEPSVIAGLRLGLAILAALWSWPATRDEPPPQAAPCRS
jgi:exosortase/archaeosortase family protein